MDFHVLHFAGVGDGPPQSGDVRFVHTAGEGHGVVQVYLASDEPHFTVDLLHIDPNLTLSGSDFVFY